jgi:hypothetical protein
MTVNGSSVRMAALWQTEEGPRFAARARSQEEATTVLLCSCEDQFSLPSVIVLGTQRLAVFGDLKDERLVAHRDVAAIPIHLLEVVLRHSHDAFWHQVHRVVFLLILAFNGHHHVHLKRAVFVELDPEIGEERLGHRLSKFVFRARLALLLRKDELALPTTDELEALLGAVRRGSLLRFVVPGEAVGGVRLYAGR